ncbi:hypothetical protein W97_06759 [Coniosporium apollinis CBS 100218]|uniref:Uncharacterized protein n=1 Tax=Coniosporium apollinis (strain CBS 100218) TaxID=1168221 RepID=R7Z151_CONA1|nr:uncharacterized protein W97_06759 [Coniosporium apollinis CBS 100218]EON67616.1 hypothetical protein W97_06759 [Coniosporium apollinis CBS 100218]
MGGKRTTPTFTARTTPSLDDGISLVQQGTSEIQFSFNGQRLSMTGTYAYAAGINIESVVVLGQKSAPTSVNYNGQSLQVQYDGNAQTATINCSIPLTGDATVTFGGVAEYPGTVSRQGPAGKLSAFVLNDFAMSYLFM